MDAAVKYLAGSRRSPTRATRASSATLAGRQPDPRRGRVTRAWLRCTSAIAAELRKVAAEMPREIELPAAPDLRHRAASSLAEGLELPGPGLTECPGCMDYRAGSGPRRPVPADPDQTAKSERGNNHDTDTPRAPRPTLHVPRDPAQPGQARRYARLPVRAVHPATEARARQYAVAFLGGYLPPF